mmetsp:Transcript_24724/g.27509  ORF Transcript_24724/g.27509 Transcript_24724/m.27509 type:complete len:400 (-) Transcript_24724:104-1303(-)
MKSAYLLGLLLFVCVIAQDPAHPNDIATPPDFGLPNDKSPAGAAYAAGRHVQIHYNECGTWNQFGVGGFVFDQCYPVDMTIPGNPWQALCFRIPYPYRDDPLVYVGNVGTTDTTPNFLSGDAETPVCNYTVREAEKFPASPSEEFVGVKHTYQVGPLVVKKIETWNFYENVVHVELFLEYPYDCCHYLDADKGYTLNDVEVAFSVDPDPDHQLEGTFETVNQRVFGEDQDAIDGMIRGGWYAESIGTKTCTTMGFGKCNPRSVVGHTRWQNCPLGMWNELRNNNGNFDDRTMAFWHKFDNITCGEKVGVNFVISVACDPQRARDQYEEAYSNLCAPDATYMPDFDDAPTMYWPYECKCNAPTGNYSEVPCRCADGLFEGVPHGMMMTRSLGDADYDDSL